MAVLQKILCIGPADEDELDAGRAQGSIERDMCPASILGSTPVGSPTGVFRISKVLA